MKAEWNDGRIELKYGGEFYNITSPSTITVQTKKEVRPLYLILYRTRGS